MRALAIIALSGLAGTCSSPPSSHAPDSLLEQIKQSGEFRVVTRNSPVTFYHGTDQPRGIDYELAQGFANWLGVDLKIYVAEPFREILSHITTGNAHVGAAGLTVTESSKALVDFGPTYQTTDQQLIYRVGSRKPKTIEDVFGKHLEILAGSAHVNVLENYRQQHPLLDWVENPYADAEELLKKISTGMIDYTVLNSNVFDILRHLHPDTRAAFDLGTQKQIAWALPKTKDESLSKSVSSYFAKIQANGELQKLHDRYYFYAEDFDYVGSRSFLRHFELRLPKYKSFFIEASKETGLDWHLLAAMAYQESHWDPQAVSYTYVRGIMMLTQQTAEMMGVEDRTDAQESIEGGARYFLRIVKKFPERISERDKTLFALAAYNVGFGHLEDARVITEIQGGDPDRWNDVQKRLPLLSQKEWYERVSRGYARGNEPVQYVNNIQRYYNYLLWMTARDISAELRLPYDDQIIAKRAGVNYSAGPGRSALEVWRSVPLVLHQ